jgi:hypothetical protein
MLRGFRAWERRLLVSVVGATRLCPACAEFYETEVPPGSISRLPPAPPPRLPIAAARMAEDATDAACAAWNAGLISKAELVRRLDGAPKTPKATKGARAKR